MCWIGKIFLLYFRNTQIKELVEKMYFFSRKIKKLGARGYGEGGGGIFMKITDFRPNVVLV